MRKLPNSAGRAWTSIGLVLALIHLTWLSAIALLDDGALARDWVETAPWILVVATPAIIAVAGFRNPRALAWAAGLSLPLALISLAGATLPLLVPAGCYLAAYLASERAETLQSS